MVAGRIIPGMDPYPAQPASSVIPPGTLGSVPLGNPAISLRDQRDRSRAALASLLVGVLMLGLKGMAWWLTGSAAILSDALESVVHVVAVGFMFWAFRFSAAPPDAEHPYGHGRAEHLSVGFEGGLVAAAGLMILGSAGFALWHGREPERIAEGFWLIVTAVVVNLTLGLWLLAVGRRTSSAILTANGHHVLSDVWTSAGVLAGVAVLWLMPPGPARIWVDAAVAVILAGLLLWTGGTLVRQAAYGLLDHADQEVLTRVVAAINEIRTPDWIDVHNLRGRSVGDLAHVDFHLVVPSTWTVAQAHDVVEALESHILVRLGHQGTVLIHLDHPANPSYLAIAAGAPTDGPITIASATRVEPVLASN